MSKFLNLALEDDEAAAEGGLADPNGKPDELDKANNMVTNEDSTDPVEVVKIANYKEEIAALKEQQAEEGTGEDDGTGDEGSEDGGSTDGSEDDEGGNEGDGTDDTGDDSGDDSSEDDSADDEGDDSGSEDESEDKPEPTADDKTEEDDKELTEAVEDFCTLRKLQTLVKKSKDRNNLTVPAMEMISITVESIKTRLGVQGSTKYEIPAMECLNGFTARQKYTETIRLALEGIVNDVWTAIVRMFQAVYNWIKDFFFNKKKTVAGAREELKASSAAHVKLQKGLKKKEELEAKNGQKSDAVMFTSKKAYLLLENGLDPAAATSLANSFNNFNTTITAQSVKLGKIVNKVIDAKEALKQFNFDNTQATDAIFADLTIEKLFDVSGMKKVSDIDGVDLNGCEAYTTSLLATNTGFYIKRLLDSDPQSKTPSGFNLQHYGTYHGTNADKTVSIRLIDNVKTADMVFKCLESLQKTREILLGYIERVNVLTASFNLVIKKLSNISEGVPPTVLQGFKNIIMILTNILFKGCTNLENSLGKYYDLLLQYHTESVKEYGLD